MPIDDGTIGGHEVHSLVNAGVFKVRRSEELLNGLQSYLVRVVCEFWRLLGYLEIEYFSLLISFNQVVTPVKLVLYNTFTIFSPEAFGVDLFCLLWIHISNHRFPFEDRITFASISINQDHNAALSTLHVSENILKVGHIFVLIEEIDNFFLEQLSLKHILDD